jgi:hypothetical protein
VLCIEELQHFLSLPHISRVLTKRRKGRAENIAHMTDIKEFRGETIREWISCRLDVDCSII